MAHLLEEELFCRFCGLTRHMLECCDRSMEFDGERLFCPSCGKERTLPCCCERPMQIRKRVRNIKKDIFSCDATNRTV